MNARQKAKKYKIEAELVKAKAEAYDRMMRAEYFNKGAQRCRGEIRTLQIKRIVDFRVPEEFVKREMAHEIAKGLFETNMIDYKIYYSDETRSREIKARLMVVEPNNNFDRW